MATTKRAIIVIRAADQARANAWVKANLDPLGGERTFTVALSTTERGAVTAYWCNWALTDAEYAALQAEFSLVDRGDGIRRLYDGRVISPDSVLLAESLVRRLPDV